MIMFIAAAIAAQAPEEPLPDKPFLSYWLTRDSEIGGALSDAIDVWIVKPTRDALSIDGGICWWHEAGVVRQVSVQACIKWCGTYPEDDRQCIRVDRPLEMPEGEPS